MQLSAQEEEDEDREALLSRFILRSVVTLPIYGFCTYDGVKNEKVAGSNHRYSSSTVRSITRAFFFFIVCSMSGNFFGQAVIRYPPDLQWAF